MKLWIDGDSFPRPALVIAIQMAQKSNFSVEIVSDRPLQLPDCTYKKIALNLVPKGSGQADEIILQNCQSGDIAATRDLELTNNLLSKGLHVLNDRGKIWTKKSLVRRLEDSRIMKAMIRGGITSRQRGNYTHQDALNFRNGLEALLA